MEWMLMLFIGSGFNDDPHTATFERFLTQQECQRAQKFFSGAKTKTKSLAVDSMCLEVKIRPTGH